MRVWRVVVLLAGCAAGAHDNARFDTLAQRRSDPSVYPAPTARQTEPWTIGQWAMYRETSSSYTAFTKIHVLAQDQCGTWIEIDENNRQQHFKLLVCMSASVDPQRPWIETRRRFQIGMFRFEDNAAEVLDFRDGKNDGRLNWLWPTTRWFGLHSREALYAHELGAVTVAAGTFTAYREVVGRHEVWTHPDVPFGGIVAIREPGWTRELVAFGTTDPDHTPVVAALLASEQRLPRLPALFIAPAVGFGWATGRDDASAAGSTRFGYTHGIRVMRSLDAIGDVSVEHTDALAPESSEQHFRAGLGVRWSPFRPVPTAARARHDFAALYGQATLGYARLWRGAEPNEMRAHGLAFGAAVGWIPMQGRDWSVGLELADRAAIYESGEGLRHGITISVVLQLHVRAPTE